MVREQGSWDRGHQNNYTDTVGSCRKATGKGSGCSVEPASAPRRERGCVCGPPGGVGTRMRVERKKGWCLLWREGASGSVTEAGAGGQGVAPVGGSHLRAVAAGPGAQIQAQAALVLDTVEKQTGEGLGRSTRSGYKWLASLRPSASSGRPRSGSQSAEDGDCPQPRSEGPASAGPGPGSLGQRAFYRDQQRFCILGGQGGAGRHRGPGRVLRPPSGEPVPGNGRAEGREPTLPTSGWPAVRPNDDLF